MNGFATGTTIRVWIKNTWCAPHWRIPLLLVVLLLAGKPAEGGILEPHLEQYENCTDTRTFRSEELKAQSRSSTLLYSVFRSHHHDASDYELLQRHNLAGLISYGSIYDDAAVVGNEELIEFTGTVVERVPSLLERAVGNGGNHFFFEVSVSGSRYLLDVESFRSPPLPICKAADINRRY